MYFNIKNIISKRRLIFIILIPVIFEKLFQFLVFVVVSFNSICMNRRPVGLLLRVQRALLFRWWLLYRQIILGPELSNLMLPRALDDAFHQTFQLTVYVLDRVAGINHLQNKENAADFRIWRNTSIIAIIQQRQS